VSRVTKREPDGSWSPLTGRRARRINHREEIENRASSESADRIEVIETAPSGLAQSPEAAPDASEGPSEAVGIAIAIAIATAIAIALRGQR
jgi:hypothetical protein